MKLKFFVGVAMTLFILIVATILVIGMTQKSNNNTSYDPTNKSKKVQLSDTLVVTTDPSSNTYTATNSNTQTTTQDSQTTTQSNTNTNTQTTSSNSVSRPTRHMRPTSSAS